MNGHVQSSLAEQTPRTAAPCHHRAGTGRPPGATLSQGGSELRKLIGWGVIVGVIQAFLPLTVWWLPATTFHAVSIGFIAAIYIGLAVAADGRPRVIAVESAVALAFVVLAFAGVNGSAWIVVVAYIAHGLKDAWQEHRHFVRGTRWWPPFCAAVDFVVAAIIAIQILLGMSFHT